ncbi:MAG: DedA family protein [Lachnospiraceae bacterium]|nr:DedA family protein [Lachnospiraceae bacterium]
MQGIVTEIIGRFGYLGIIILIFVENIFPPIPSEVILTFGGFLTTCTDITVLGVTFYSTIGSVLGAMFLFGVGKIMSPERLDKFADRKMGRILKVKKENIEKARMSFLKKGNNAVFFCRFVPIVRSLISIPAGMAGMNYIQFLILTTLGSFAWNLVLISLGAFAGKSWESAAKYLAGYSDIVRIALWMIVGIFVLKKIFEKMASKKAGKGT